MPEYKLTYFNGKGRAEVARLMFAAAGVQYEDVRLEREQWPPLKPSTPFGQLPMLEVDGTKICQSNAISRFLANRFGFMGKNEFENATIDMIVDCLEDVVKPAMKIAFQIKDETEKAAEKKKYEEESLPGQLALLEKLLVSNGGGDQYFVGDKLSFADIQFSHMIGFPTMLGVNIAWDSYPKLKALKDRVESQNGIQDWIAKRPQTQF